MAVDMFLDIKGEIKGESQDKTHKDEIDVLAWSWGMSQSGSFHVGGGGVQQRLHRFAFAFTDERRVPWTGCFGGFDTSDGGAGV